MTDTFNQVLGLKNHAPLNYDSEDISDAEREEALSAPPAWTKKYIGTPKWFRDNFPGFDEDPCNAFILIMALMSSKHFHEMDFYIDRDTVLRRVKYWYGADSDYRGPVDQLLIDLLLARGEDYERLAEKICVCCFQFELPMTPAELSKQKVKP